MKTSIGHAWGFLAPLMLIALDAGAQVAVDAYGQPFEEVDTGAADVAGAYTDAELDALVAPVALYPDDLLAIVLPAATYPLQIVEAGRFLDALETDPALEPDPDWDDSVVALLNYPEVVELLNEDLDWTWQLGDAVVGQQDAVIAAVETFRNRAHAAGNLQSDEYQQVSHDEGVIEILPVSSDIIHVPYYEPERVVVAQPARVYHYYPEPRPVYYYPYADDYAFRRGYFWGVTTAFSIGWASDRLRVYHSSYRGHPYYGRRYYDRWWYRRPTISVHRTTYSINRFAGTTRHFDRGDYWRPNRHVRLRRSDQRITRSYYTQDRRARGSTIHRSPVRQQSRRIKQGLARQPSRQIRRLGSARPEVRRERLNGAQPQMHRNQRSASRGNVQRGSERARSSRVPRREERSVRREQQRSSFAAAPQRDRRREARTDRRPPERANRSQKRDRGIRRKADRRPR